MLECKECKAVHKGWDASPVPSVSSLLHSHDGGLSHMCLDLGRRGASSPDATCVQVCSLHAIAR